MPPDRSGSADAEKVAHRLFDPAFAEEVAKASRPVFPRQLAPRREELIYDALLKAYERRDQFHGSSHRELLAWVLVILQNLTRDILDAEAALPQVVSLPTIEPAGFRSTDDALHDNPEDMVDPARRHAGDDEIDGDSPNGRLRRDLRRLLDRLEPEEREVLMLRFGREFTLEETAALLSTPDRPVSIAAVKMRQRRAIEHLEELARLRGSPSAPTAPESAREVGGTTRRSPPGDDRPVKRPETPPEAGETAA